MIFNIEIFKSILLYPSKESSMDFYKKRRFKRVIPLIAGCLLATLTIIKPVMIFFILPVIAILYQKRIKKNKPLILFLISFLIVYIPYMRIEHISLNEQVLITYNLLKNEIIDTNLGVSKPIEKSRILDDFEEKNDLVLESNNESAELIATNKEFHEGKKSLQLEINTPTKNEIILQKKISPSNWNEYDYLNLWIKNKGVLGGFGIILVDEDGDWWHYDNDQILKKQEWTLLKISLASLKNYEWTHHGNRRLDSIVGYKLKFEPYPKKSDYTVFIDDIHLSKF